MCEKIKSREKKALIIMEVKTECSHEKSNEEEDLHRSNKRIREEVDIPSHFEKEQVHLSFWDKLMGLQANNAKKDTYD